MEPSLILISLGTHQQAFPRALDLIEPLAGRYGDLVIQHGSTSPRPNWPDTTWIEIMAFDDLTRAMSEAKSVVCHGGVGTVMTALQKGHTPVVIPRLACHREHVDDHQMEIAEHFAERGLVRCVTTETDLAPLLSPRSAEGSRRLGRGSEALRRAVLAASR
jgi:UDP-N-acetylglucosamine--N-acetylmuramyl-(pentapeptide) pyrophosphoryl-undecaprenol N-acetylglucosamine transferase